MKKHKPLQQVANKGEQEYDMIALSFGTLVFSDEETPYGSVHQFQTKKFEVFVPGGQFGVKHEKTYFVALDDFQAEKLTNIMKKELETMVDNPHEAQKAWFKRFSDEIIDGIFSFAAQKHGGMCRVYGDIETKSELDILYTGDLLEITPTDFTVSINSRRRNGRSRASISMQMSNALAFLSQPEEPEFSAQGDFTWEDAQGDYIYKGKKYHFQLSFDVGFMRPDMVFNKESFQISLRKTLNAAIKDVTGQTNAVEKLVLY